MRKQYIENNDLEAALKEYRSRFNFAGVIEDVSPLGALDRVTAEVVYAKICDPTYNAAAMDGIQVAAENTFSADESSPLELIRGKDFEYVNTGGIIDDAYNAVIMIEDVIILSEDKVKILAPAYPWQHVRVIGESVVAGELILPSKHVVAPQDMGALAASGNKTIKVFARPRVGIIPTGKEMVGDPDLLGRGKLMESNSKAFAALTVKYGGEYRTYPVVEDNGEKLKAAIGLALAENDIVVVNAGSSAGTKDYTVRVIEELGEVVVHGIAVKPGKPTILGIVGGKPVIGIPGYPVSAYLMFEEFVRPIITDFGKRTEYGKVKVKATLTRRLVSSFKNSELIRVTLGEVGGKLRATPLERAASAVMSLVKADGILKIDRLTEGLEAGAEVEVTLMKPIEDIMRSLVITGSHDMIIDVIADSVPLTSAHVGSMGGISALLRGECHIAPIHLLDEITGGYNVSYVKEYFSDKKMALIKGVGRAQGLLTAPGNPKKIINLADAIERGLRYANRQRGAGTRILFDYELKKLGYKETDVSGYEKEYGTHLAVASAVVSGAADCGMAVYSAAKALNSGFIPIAEEEYDFLLPAELLSDPRVEHFIDELKSDEFKDKIKALGGYTAERSGEVILP